jgi:hypothetical protein
MDKGIHLEDGIKVQVDEFDFVVMKEPKSALEEGR